MQGGWNVGKVIAIVDDEIKIRKMIQSFIQNEGFETLEAGDGNEAVQLIENHEVDLLLLDVMMPNKDGFQTLRDIRMKHKKIPVIMLTAKSEEIDKLLGLEMGADDYITKPFSMRELAARIRAVLRRSSEDGASNEEDEVFLRSRLKLI